MNETTIETPRVNGEPNRYTYAEWRVKQLDEKKFGVVAAKNAHRREIIALAPACIYCGRAMNYEKMTLDHIRPKSRGGSDSKYNLAICCHTCNQAKGARGPFRWAMCIMIGAWRWRLAAMIRG